MECQVIFLALLCMATWVMGAPNNTFNVMNFGAVGDGRTDDSQAFLKAWNGACNAESINPIIYVIPKTKTFLLQPLTFSGPCQSSSIHMLVEGNITAPEKKAWNGEQINAWLIFSEVNGLTVNGKGTIDGEGPSWWPDEVCFQDPQNGIYCKGPTGMIFRRCNSLRLNGFSKINGPGSHILIMTCRQVIISNVSIIAPGDSPNTDGIGVSNSKNVHIRNSYIGTGDDCIAISAGSSNITVSTITCGPGHGISVGSLGSGGYDVVENVNVRNCTLKETLTGIRIKTLQGGKGYARNISFRAIKFEAVDNPIQIDQYYCPLKVNCQNYTSSVAISDVSFVGIIGTSIAENVINLSCSENSVGCINIKVERVYIKSSIPGNKVYANCYNAHGIATHTSPIVKCLLP